MAKVKQPINEFIEAIKFLSLCQEKNCEEGQERLSYCTLAQGTAVAFNGAFGAGCFIQEDFYLTCPHTHRLLLALEGCEQTYAITQLEESLLVRSGEFAAYVPLCKPSALPGASPDALQYPLDDRFLAALKIVYPLPQNKAEFVLTACIQLNNGSVIATNREVLIEAWHGFAMPDELLLPKQTASALLDCKKKLIGCGIADDRTTLTFWFDGNAWIKTRLYADKLRDFKELLNTPSNPRLLPSEFFGIVKQVAPFSSDGNVYCGESSVDSHWRGDSNHKGATLSIPLQHGPCNRIYTIKGLKLISKLVKTIDENSIKLATLFYGEGLRGAISHLVYSQPVKTADGFIVDDDIPF